jgi:hypothetical protein
MAVAFKNAAEQTFRTTTLGPLGFNGDAISLQQQIGLVPAGTVVITLTLTLIRNCENAAECAWAAADDLSLILNPLGTSAGMVLGTNLITNGGAEAGPVLCTQPPPRTFPDGPPRAEPPWRHTVE